MPIYFTPLNEKLFFPELIDEAEGIGSFQNAYSLIRKFKVLPPPSIPLHCYFLFLLLLFQN